MSYRGPYSEVYRCAKRDTGQNYAVKIVDVAQYTSSPNLSIEGTADECPACKSLSMKYSSFFFLFRAEKGSIDMYQTETSTYCGTFQHLCKSGWKALHGVRMVNSFTAFSMLSLRYSPRDRWQHGHILI